MTQPIIDILSLTLGTPKASDHYPAVDTTDFSMSPVGTTKQYLLADLYAFILIQFGFVNVVQPSCIAASIGNLNAIYANGPNPLSPGINATLTDASGTFLPFVLDGVTIGLNNFPVLIKNQTNPAQNGIYVLIQNGSVLTSTPWVLMRVSYFNTPSNIFNGKIVIVSNGNTNANTTWILQCTNPVTVGTTALNFIPFSMSTPTGLLPWIDVTSSTFSTSPNTGYIADNNISRVSLVLPSVIAEGSIIEVAGKGTQGWIINQQAGQQINFGTAVTTVGVTGSLSSTQQFDSIRLLCISANTQFVVLSSIGNITVV